MNKIGIYILTLIFFSACSRIEKQEKKNVESSISKIQPDSTLANSNGWINIQQMNVRQLMSALAIDSKKKNGLNIVSTLGVTDPGWLNMDDLEFLVSMIESQQECKCINRVISSYIPDSKNMTIGNQAISILEAFRNKEAFPNDLTICQFHGKEKVAEIKKWWTEYKNGSEQRL